MSISLIAAMSETRVIGINNDLPPWKISEDMKRFRTLTTGKVIVMGRKTFDSIGRCLPGRWTVVVSRKLKPRGSGAAQETSHSLQSEPHIVNSLEDAFLEAERLNPGGEIMVAGGGEIYKQALSHANKIYLTVVKGDWEGDTYFPILPASDGWDIVDMVRRETHIFVTLEKFKVARPEKLFMVEAEDQVVKPATKPTNNYEELGRTVGALVDVKNKAYGSAFDDAGEFLELLYPRGITPDQYGDALALVRIFDKMKRIATNKDALGESPYQDIAGYGLLGLKRSETTRAKESLKIAANILLNSKKSTT